jgi:hypothetical protein
MIVVAYAVGSVVAVAAVLASPGSVATVFPIVVTAASIAVAAVIVLAWRRASLEGAIARIRGAQSVVATGLIEAPPVDVARLIAEVRRLGFETVGAVDTTIGGPPHRTWVLAETGEPATTWAEVGVPGKPIAIFLSRGGDGRFLESSFPHGEAIDHPNLLARPIKTGVESALREHRATLAEWTSLSGPPLVVRTIDDYRRVEAELQERTGGLRIAAHLDRSVKPALRMWAISAAIGTIAFFVVVLLPGP